jgi:hypothetical protein
VQLFEADVMSYRGLFKAATKLRDLRFSQVVEIKCEDEECRLLGCDAVLVL